MRTLWLLYHALLTAHRLGVTEVGGQRGVTKSYMSVIFSAKHDENKADSVSWTSKSSLHWSTVCVLACLALPGNFFRIEHVFWHVHTVLMEPLLAFIAFHHINTFLLRHSASAVQVNDFG